jgi:ElaB/YqjD/DUF883 family membrane-anchored ribosome-binding protein
MENTAQIEAKRDTLVSDLKALISDAENLLRTSGQQMSERTDDRYRTARMRFENTLSNAKTGLSSLEQSVSARTRVAMDSTDQYVKEHPWQSVGIGALAGLAFGFLMMMRR